METDLLEHFHGVDLLDFYRGRLSLRRLAALLKRLLRLPGRSALAAAVDARAQWSPSQYLLAEVIDRVELSNWLAVEINAEHNDLPFPDPVSRPGDVQETSTPTEFATAAELAEVFALR